MRKQIKENTFFSVQYISDVAETAKFWEEIGAEVKENRDDKAVINLGGFEVHYILDSTEPFNEYQFATKTAGRGTGTLLYFQVENIEDFYSSVQKVSPKILTPIKKNHWDSREFMFCDPDGYLFVAYE